MGILSLHKWRKQLMSNSLTQEQFALLPSAAKRVEIAKDVIKHLDTQRLTAGHGGYASIPHILGEDWNNDDVEMRDILNRSKDAACKVCALGALFIADILKRDNFTMGDYKARSTFYNTRQKVGDYFELDQLNLIESAYEVSHMHTTDVVQAVKAQEFKKEIWEPKDRLTAIMENIIENYGTFIP